MNRFGPILTADIRSRQVEAMRAHRQWQRRLDEVYVKIGEVTHCHWRAVDHQREVLENIVTKSQIARQPLSSRGDR